MGTEKSIEMKIHKKLLYFNLIQLSFALYSRCEIAAKDKAFTEIQSCKTESLGKISRKYQRELAYKTRRLERRKSYLHRRLCDKVTNIYEPNGLFKDIPSSWNCSSDPFAQAVLKDLDLSKLRVPDGDNAYNIVIVGETGTGKSYFANGLLGSLNPGRDGNEFSVRGGKAGHTQNISVASGLLFGGRYDSDLGLSESIKINVFDTPGLKDSNVTNVRKNKLLIATALQQKIDMVIILTVTPRFDDDIQSTLRMLNDWTGGSIWGNMVHILGRFSFNEEDVANRAIARDPLTMFDLKNNDEDVDFLMRRQEEENWTRKHLNGETMRESPLSRDDFQKMHISLLNMAQLNKCIRKSTNPGPEIENPGRRCWKLPLYENLNYIIEDYDYVTLSDKFAFIEEAKSFWTILKEMKRHPISPAAQLFRHSLMKDIALFDSFAEQAHELEVDLADKQKDEETKASIKCDSIQPDTKECPFWGSWTSWATCSTACGPVYEIHRSRSCYARERGVKKRKNNDVCEHNFENSASSSKACLRNSCPQIIRVDSRPIRGWVGDRLSSIGIGWG